MKTNLTYILLIFYIFCFQSTIGQTPIVNKFEHKINTKTLLKSDTTKFKKDNKKVKKYYISKDSIAKDSIKKPNEKLNYVVTHNAKDYTIQNTKNRTITLYNEAHIVYGDIDLKAGKIIVDYKKNTVYAKGIKDSTSKYIQRPIFKQGQQESEQDSILFNFKTKKALIYGIKTIEGEMITYGEKTKRINDSTIYMRKLRFTTSNKKNPDYYILTNKAKLVPGKKIIVGGSQLYIADVPTPLYLPFAYFPLSKKRASGFIIPSWGENNQQGFFLQNGGYYFAINDYFDLETTADVYTNGSWGGKIESNYYVRYKFSGRFSFRYQNLITSIKGFNDYSKTSSYNISWSHSQDSKSNPNSRLSASVNLGSSQFYRESLNINDASQFLNNTLNSSITYTKKFVGTPFNMSLSMTHNQNSNNKSINMTLPSLQLNMDRIYPFKGKGGVKKNPIQKMGFNYSMNGKNTIETTDDDFLTAKMFKSSKMGLRHNLSTSTNLKVLKYLTLSANISYRDIWCFDRIEKHYDPNLINDNGKLGSIKNDTISGFNRFNGYNINASLSTVIYGIVNIKKGRLRAIRHTLTPSISWGYRPDFATKYELQVQKSADPTNILTYSPFENGIYGTPSKGESNSINFSINNLLEAKVKPKEEDEEEEFKKVTILNNLNFSSSYNFKADSLKWSTVSFNAGTRLFKDRMNINLNGSLDPYQVTLKGLRINKFNKNIFRLTQVGLTANFSISNKDFDKEPTNKITNSNSNKPPDVFGASIGEDKSFSKSLTEKTKKVTELYKSKIPWNISFVYSSTYTNNGYSTSGIQNHTVGFNGNLELSPKWKIGFASGYDIKNKDFSYTRLNFSRDLDSWRFNFNWVPFGFRTSYNFFIGVKSSMLSDLKWDKTKPPDKRLF